MELTVRNVNHAFSEIFWKLKVLNLQPEDTRNGRVLAFPEPVTTTFLYPCERVLFHEGRDANPIFHLLESVWLLAGRRDVDFVSKFNSKIGQYSDNGDVFNAAYGYRWRTHFGFDQLIAVIDTLRQDPTTRQAVLTMWDPADLVKITKDKACNLQALFDRRGGVLNLTVFNRSNDIWWGAYGANAVQFSILQEFVAQSLGIEVGVYRQISNNFHLYLDLYNAQKYIFSPPAPDLYDYYTVSNMKPRPLMDSPDYVSFLTDCRLFCDDPFNWRAQYQHSFFNRVAKPLAMVSYDRKHGGDGIDWAEQILADDWRLAVFHWIRRREEAKNVAPA